MSGIKLSALQQKLLILLSDIDPPWTLAGGAALVGFHLGHRSTKDLDLFWRQREMVGDIEQEVMHRCNARHLSARVIQRTSAFVRILVSDTQEQIVLDLVAEAAPALKEALKLQLEDAFINVATTTEILAAKLCALLSRSELRDLHDVMALLDSGEELEGALKNAAEQDTGFSALTLAWILEKTDFEPIAKLEKLNDELIKRLVQFKEDLINLLISSAKKDLDENK